MGGLVSDLLAIPGLFIIPIFELSSLVTLAVTLVLAPLFEAPAFTSSQAVKAVWFKYLWWWFGPVSKPIFAPSVRPVLEQARGVVLDIGPASGIWIRDLSQSVKAGRVSKIYGVEPNVRFHPQLIANTKAHGIEDVYKPIAAYAQDLKTHGIEEKSIDTIITVHVLCSVGPQVDQVVEQLYQYLKPGGQWLVYEHVGSHNVAVRAWQRKSTRTQQF